jgi:hypothetical protein
MKKQLFMLVVQVFVSIFVFSQGEEFNCISGDCDNGIGKAEYMQENQKVSSTTLDKSVDALTFLMTHRKNAPDKMNRIVNKNLWFMCNYYTERIYLANI